MQFLTHNNYLPTNLSFVCVTLSFINMHVESAAFAKLNALAMSKRERERERVTERKREKMERVNREEGAEVKNDVKKRGSMRSWRERERGSKICRQREKEGEKKEVGEGQLR